VFSLEAPGNPQDVARQISADIGKHFGHITAILQEVESRVEAIRSAAVRIAQEQIRPGQTFSFRLYKRGSHWISSDTQTTEREIGEAMAETIEAATGRRPQVDLEAPDIAIVAEVLGPTTGVGIQRSGTRTGRIP
jgi:tRNA(Ser,Leu) C12 N-acetylase TAN1